MARFVNRLFLATATLWAASQPGLAHAAIRALFVGIDTYAYSAPGTPDAGFKNLRGAVADAGRIKEALRDAYGLDLDLPASGCASSNAVSTTLTDSCATRDAIMSELAKRIDQSSTGDTILFYYAGHGSRIADTKEYDQASGFSATTLTYDARGPSDDRIVEILDREFKRVRNSAIAKGVNIVTIFDSCFSRTATRTVGRGARRLIDEGEERSAASRIFSGVAQVPSAPDIVQGSGYWVHLAAADENEKAREVPLDRNTGTRAGVFTTALATTLREMPGATFDDIMNEVRRKVQESGIISQSPQIEGQVLATLGGATRTVTLLSAQPSADGVELLAGRLFSVSEGSTYAIFADSTSAIRDANAPLAKGVVTKVDSFRAAIRLDALPLEPLPARLVAREIQHAFGVTQLRVRIDALKPGSQKAIAQALAASRVATVAEPAQYVVSTIDRADQIAALLSLDKRTLERLGATADPEFANRLQGSLEKLARVSALLAQRTDPRMAAVTICVNNDVHYDVFSCPPPNGPKGRRVIEEGKVAKVTVTQTGPTPRYVYVFAIDDAQEITQIVPEPGATDPPLEPGKPNWYAFTPKPTSNYRLVTIASDEPIKDSAPSRESASSANAGRLGGWTAIVTDVDVMRAEVP